MTDAPKRPISRAQRSIQKAIEEADTLKRKEMTRIRFELARKGVSAFEKHHSAEAAICFKTYIRVLEELKNVDPGGLHPGLFSLEKDLHELLLISGIYWDLMKLYDRTESADRRREFLHYTEKFIAFSNGMPYQSICAETVRKYISNKNPLHKEDFKNTYKIIGKPSKCYVATALIDVCDEETLPILRNFRDTVLARSAAGRTFTKIYYRVGPALARLTDVLPEFLRVLLGRALSWLAAEINEG